MSLDHALSIIKTSRFVREDCIDEDAAHFSLVIDRQCIAHQKVTDTWAVETDYYGIQGGLIDEAVSQFLGFENNFYDRLENGGMEME